ncbi:hypothetical protein [Rosenbergiella australiborealis]|uniref:hypothetical protein n=1 Tax=Rosenbergiella australiborealis TaxID=1544696 RepID=UPI001F4D6F35|nr:hypothetical protein [Rosenbergiella australiborealis]
MTNSKNNSILSIDYPHSHFIANGYKAYAPQSEINADIAVKGSSVLFDPNLDIVEQQRYRNAIEKRNNSW